MACRQPVFTRAVGYAPRPARNRSDPSFGEGFRDHLRAYPRSRRPALSLLESPSIPWMTTAGRESREHVDTRGVAGY